MATNTKTFRYTIDKNFISNYDEILNCQLNKQYMDTGFLDNDKLSIGPRSYIYTVGDAYTARKSDIFFYTDKSSTTRAYSIFNNTTNGTRSYGLYYTSVDAAGSLGVWTLVTGALYTSAVPVNPPDFKMSTVQAPVMNSGSVFPCNTVNISTVTDRVKRNMATDIDANTGNRSGANAIGKILQVISEPSYTGVYAFVTGYDAATDEYIIEGSGAVIPFRISMLYGIYDRLAPVLQLKSSLFLDRYYDWLTEDGQLRGLATYSLRISTFLSSTEFILDQVLYNNSYWTYIGGTLLSTRWFPGNPFYYTLLSGSTVATKKITGIYVYKNRLMVYGLNFLYAYTSSGVIERLSDTIGVQDDAIFSTGDDLYIISNQSSKSSIISVNELSSGTLYIKNITKQLSNYMTNFIEDCFIGSDNKNIYFWGNARDSGAYVNFTYLLVYSLEYKFWSIYAIPTASSIVSYNNVAYFTSRYTSNYMNFGWDLFGQSYGSSLEEAYYTNRNTTTVSGFTNTPFTQKISTRWNDIGDIFTLKQPSRILLSLDNVSNNIGVTQFMVLDEKITSSPKKTFSLTQISSSSVLGLWVTGLEITGGTSVASDTLVPRLKTIPYVKWPCNAVKIVCESVNSNGFYLNGLAHEIEVNTSTNDYQNPNSTN